MATGDSRLWRKLRASAPVFSVQSNGTLPMTLNDSDITSITMTRGSDGEQFGPQDHTLEVHTVRTLSPRTGEPIRCELTNYGANLIADRLFVDKSEIQQRFYGRIGRTSAEDNGGNRYDVDLRVSFYASKWQSQLEYSDRVGNQINGEWVDYLMNHFMNTGVDLVDYQPPAEFPDSQNDYGRMYNTYDLSEAKIKYSEFVSKYLTAPGFYVQNTRAGADRVLTIKHRYDQAIARMDNWMPLTRHQCLSPSQWDQPRENSPRNQKVIWQDPTGTRSLTRGPDVNNVRVPLVETDFRYIQFYDNYQPIQLAAALYGAERLDMGYYVPSVVVDLLHLIDSDSAYDRMQARQLLQMEMGDPVYLSGDWHNQVEGIMFATGIKETIDPDRWEIEISLLPSLTAIGVTMPEVPPRTWESAAGTWDDETRIWDH